MNLLLALAAAHASPISAPATIGAPDSGPATADPAAMHYNPAAIGASDGFDALADVQLSFIDVKFTPTRNDGVDPNTGEKYIPAEAHAIVPVGLLGVTWKPVKWGAIGVAAVDSFVGGGDYSGQETDPPPYTGAQRYAGVTSKVITLSVIPGIALTPVDGFHVGGGFAYVYDNVTILKVSDPLGNEGLGFTGTPYEYDVVLDASGTGSHTMWNAGIFVDRWKFLQVGASYTSGGQFNAEGKAEVTAPDALAEGEGSVTIPGDFTFSMPLPAVLRAGAVSEINDKLKVGATIEYYMWKDCCGGSSGDAYITLNSEDGDPIGPEDGLSIEVANEINSPRRLWDSMVISANGGYWIIPSVWVGGRLGYKQYAVPDYAVSATNLDFDAYGVSLAARYRFAEKFSIGVAYTKNFLVDRTITNSAWDADPESDDYVDDRFTTELPYNASSNGTYSAQSNIVGVRLQLDL